MHLFAELIVGMPITISSALFCAALKSSQYAYRKHTSVCDRVNEGFMSLNKARICALQLSNKNIYF